MPTSQFDDAVKQAIEGKQVSTTPRELISWFGVSRRGRNVVAEVKSTLRKKKVETFPDFEAIYIDDPTVIRARKKTGGKEAGKDGRKAVPTSADGADSIATSDSQLEVVEPAHRVSRLKAASRPPLSVKPGDTLNKAVTMMLHHDYSQLPVMATQSKVAGMVSWRSIGRKLHIGGPCNKVEDCIERAFEVPATASLFEVIQMVAKHDSVVVRAETNLISGIVTNADISRQFGTLAEPFLLLGDIENVLRRLIEHHFDKKELKSAVDPSDTKRPIDSVNDLSFGEYLRLVEKPENWSRLNLPLDRAVVVNKLEQVRKIRNDVMHFDPDPLDDASLDLLRSFSAFLSGLLDILK